MPACFYSYDSTIPPFRLFWPREVANMQTRKLLGGIYPHGIYPTYGPNEAVKNRILDVAGGEHE